MQKKVIQGVPFWVDAQNRIYVFETKEVPANPIWLGTYNTQSDTVELAANWRELYAMNLEDYRKKAAPRARVPQ